ncbi:hypothetical protein [Roseovarius nanhaiticus]|uniref:hypothetical protein n=1 Tax=Roseovarius nanhaiticus TaxID=573024 RepID=UPI002491D0B4|nr:hypothetical protein [Roseovarius nanhaiticus]
MIANSAAAQLHQTGHSSVVQHLGWRVAAMRDGVAVRMLELNACFAPVIGRSKAA